MAPGYRRAAPGHDGTYSPSATTQFVTVTNGTGRGGREGGAAAVDHATAIARGQRPPMRRDRQPRTGALPRTDGLGTPSWIAEQPCQSPATLRRPCTTSGAPIDQLSRGESSMTTRITHCHNVIRHCDESPAEERKGGRGRGGRSCHRHHARPAATDVTRPTAAHWRLAANRRAGHAFIDHRTAESIHQLAQSVAASTATTSGAPINHSSRSESSFD